MTTSTHRTGLFSRSTRPWVVPVAITSVVVAAAVAVPVIADADSELPERSAGELLAGLVNVDDVPLAGTVVHSADLGIPDLPDIGGNSAGSPLALLSGNTSARIWYGGPSEFRVSLYGDLTESDVIRDGDKLWYWDSEQNVVMTQTMDELQGLDDGGGDMKSLPEGQLSPEVMAELALSMIEPSTEVEVDGTATVAGRAAHELVIKPRDERSLVESVRVAIDGEHGVPLRIRIYSADGGDPAVEVGFTSISFDEPDRSVFEFSPPPGASVEELDASHLMALQPGSDKLSQADKDQLGLNDVKVETLGDGWLTALSVTGLDLETVTGNLEELAGEYEEVGDLSGLVDAFKDEMEPMSGPYGSGLGYESRLVSVLWLDDGRLLIGAVGLDVLENYVLEEQAK